MIRLCLIDLDAKELNDILSAAAPKESGAFFLLHEGRGANGQRLLATDPIFPSDDTWDEQGDGLLRPSARWISAAISHAINNDSGLLFVHSHPDPCHPIGFSPIDHSAITALAHTIGPLMDGPFAAAVVHPEGWAAAVVRDGQLVPVDRISTIGRILRFLGPPQLDTNDALTEVDVRQRDALGKVHDRLRKLDVAVVGIGGLGSPVADQLVRMGVRSITIVDHDVLDTPSNIRRMLGTTSSDLRATAPPPKVDVVGRYLDQIGLGAPVQRIAGDVRSERVFRALLDADVVICATDTHGSRAVLNDLASTYLLPVVDVGVQAGARMGELAALIAEVCVLTPITPCLWCRSRISAEIIRAENLPPDQRDRLVQEGYLIGGVGAPAPSVMALTILGAGLASCALLGLLSTEGDVCHSGYWVDGIFGDSGVTNPVEPDPACWCRHRIGAGDTKAPSFLPDR